ncbi:glycosyltransferase family 1 protein [Clavulina sp. PMI_390]|nr:glycosyltransferase family 1 protein [Clavulina sp. PMI_390]
MLWLWALVLCALLLATRAYAVVIRPIPPSRKKSPNATCGLAVFLGSGGHTSEALMLLDTLDFSRYTPRTYIVSEGDILSAEKATALERSHNSSNDSFRIITLPRARRVHQSFISTPPTFLKSLVVSFNELTFKPALKGRPFAEVVILNGPGTCVAVCLAAYLSRILGLPAPRIIYVESFARVKSLSLSAKLLQPVVNKFIVQWPNILADRGRGECQGWLV